MAEAVSQSTMANIQGYYTKESALTDKEKQVQKRLELTYNLLVHYKSKTVVAKFLQKIDVGGKSISEVTAYKYINSAAKLFGEIRKFDKDFLRFSIIDAALKQKYKAEQMITLALDNKDHELYKIASDIVDKADAKIIKAGGLDRDDPDAPDFSKLEGHTYVILLDDEKSKKFAGKLKEGVVDYSQEYADFEELIENELDANTGKPRERAEGRD